MTLRTNCPFGMIRHPQTPPSPHSPPLSNLYMGCFQSLALAFWMSRCFSRGLGRLAQVNCLLHRTYCQHNPCVLACAASRTLWSFHQGKIAVPSVQEVSSSVLCQALRMLVLNQWKLVAWICRRDETSAVLSSNSSLDLTHLERLQ